MIDAEFAAKLFARHVLTGVVAAENVYFEIPSGQMTNPPMPSVELPTSTSTHDGKFTRIVGGWVVLASTKLEASAIALQLAEAISNEHGFPITLDHGYIVLGGEENPAVVPIPGTDGIKRYSVMGALHVYRSE